MIIHGKNNDVRFKKNTFIYILNNAEQNISTRDIIDKEDKYILEVIEKIKRVLYE